MAIVYSDELVNFECQLALFTNEIEYEFGDTIRMQYKYSISIYNFGVTLGLFI